MKEEREKIRDKKEIAAFRAARKEDVSSCDDTLLRCGGQVWPRRQHFCINFLHLNARCIFSCVGSCEIAAIRAIYVFYADS